jgi:hypothetical protein
MIVSPKSIPLNIDFFLFSLPLIKNETVMGIIGNTQGVRVPAKPAKNAKMKKANKPFEALFSLFVMGAITGALDENAEVESGTIKIESFFETFTLSTLAELIF